jgi:NADPH-dependent glutamate synthase beta subunit-like oxidoreductase
LKEKGAASRFRLNAQGLGLSGCPLGQKISQMHALRQKGHILGALAMILVDNPLAVLSGLRICTDCEASCIFQNHQPISTPQIETEIVGTVLNVRWGVEIYALLARWNPLNLRTPLPKPLTGYEVLVVGLGPAGLCLAHYLTQEGHKVWGVDGQKIDPLDPALL